MKELVGSLRLRVLREWPRPKLATASSYVCVALAPRERSRRRFLAQLYPAATDPYWARMSVTTSTRARTWPDVRAAFTGSLAVTPPSRLARGVLAFYNCSHICNAGASSCTAAPIGGNSLGRGPIPSPYGARRRGAA